MEIQAGQVSHENHPCLRRRAGAFFLAGTGVSIDKIFCSRNLRSRRADPGAVHLLTSFEPISTPNARTLILGTMPGKESLRAQEYYVHRRNSFWRIMGEFLGFSTGESYGARADALTAHGIALWDVLAACEREGSLDSKIQMATAEPNDFQTFLARHPSIQQICFNGQKAAHLFDRLVVRRLSENTDVPNMLVLPSTSPANAGMSYEEKLLRWRQIM